MKIFTRSMIALFLWVTISNLQAQNIVINELLASNTASIQDEDNSREDWIELYNKGAVSVNLSGYGLSDDPALPFKWTFPNVSIAAGQYLIIWASDKNRAVAGQPLHTNFKISGSGEALYLTNPSGTTVDSSPAANLPANVSYGRLPNGTGPFVFFGTPTPNTVNSSTGYSGTLNPPSFSQNAGFYPSNISVALSTTEPGTTILYTLDGSEPDENNLSGTTYTYKNQYIENPGQSSGPLLNNSYRTFQYSAPLSITDRTSQPNDLAAMSSTFSNNPTYIPSFNVFKSTTVRAKVIKPGYLPSPIITKNYFITPLGSSKYSFPVVSINLNEDRFFGYDNGIFVAGKDFDQWRAANPNGSAKASQRGNYYLEVNDERTANLSYFVGGNEVINQEVGLKIRGGVSRRFQSKSLSVFARSDYGDDNLSYNFFSNLPYNSYERLTLSNSGGDFFSTMFRDAFLHDLCKELYPEKEAYQPTIAFVNGEYWGILNMRERYDDNYFKRVYNTSAVDFLENDSVVKEGDATHYTAMVNYLNNNSLATQANYDYIKTQLDPENVADYFIANIFFQNEDWPNNNMFFWRNKIAAYNPAAPYGLDGRWRYMFHDMDNSMSFVFGDYTSNSLAIATSVNTAPNYLNPAYSTLVLRKLLVNSSFKNDFINRFADLLNTSFLTNRTVTRLHEMSAVVRPEITGHSARWKAPDSLGSFDSDVDYEEEFLTERPTWQRDHIRSVFSIQNNITATLNVNDAAQGFIKMNTINIAQGTPGITAANPYPWSGIYFKNIPVKLKAVAKPGYIFSHWSGASTSTDAEITLTPSANFSITAHFVADTNSDVFVPIYFWMMDGNIVNGAQLTSLNTTYELATDGVIQYQSCLSGYPYASTSPNYSKASMERRNNPTSINYRQTINGNIAYASSNMRGLQIKQPFQSNGLENTMVFQFSTAGYKKPKFTFAAVDEGAASGISVDYSVNAGTPIWITTGLTSTSLALTSTYQLFTVDFSTIASADNNPNFKIRFRFTGSNMTVDNGARVTFNNIAVDAVQLKLSYPSPNSYIVGTAITALSPTTSETILSYSVSPALPAGLTLNTSTGVISGTPTVVSPTTTYTVTGTKASGSVSFGVVINVNEAAPSNLSYPSPNVFTVNSAIPNLNPTHSGGAVLSYSVSPSLPNGLSLNVLTGVISGTPTAEQGASTYTVTATNSGGSTSFGIVISVNDVAPSNLSYTTPNVFTKNTAISNLTPSVSGGSVVSYSIAPALPSGLNLNTSTGVISGTPTQISSITTYTITAANAFGSTTFDLQITVKDIAPSALSYNSPNIFTKDVTIGNLNPTVSGGAVVQYVVSPALPAGLSIDATTGIISGTPTNITSLATYTVTASNSGGSTSFGVVITVRDAAPTALSYPTPNVFVRNTTITPLTPTVSGGTVVSFSITPSLSSGLSLNTATGVISGTPTALRTATNYTVTATNTGGSTSFIVNITVNETPPTNLSYNTPNIFTRGTVITALNPSVSGGAVSSYSISPSLSAGLVFNTSTGRISGTPSVIRATTIYTITATNSGGSTSFDVSITVNDIPPSNLSYNTPNVYTRGTAIANLNPTISGGPVTAYSISPSLSAGLNFNTSTGRISGTPSAIQPLTVYTVTATNSGGSVSFDVSITVKDIAPTNLSYNSPNIYTLGVPITHLHPSISGGTVVNYSISPNLPSGLTFNTANGEIEGTPNAVSAAAIYTVTAINSGGSTSFGISITVNDVAPSALSYNSPNVFTVGSPIANLVPTFTGNVSSFSIAPSLPSGLSFDTTSGLISGTPNAVSPAAIYTVTAFNSGGSTSFGVSITVNDVAPSTLSYPSPNVFTVGSSIANLVPNFTGNITSFSIAPALPSGLSFDTTTGIISGTPNAVSSTAIYTVTAFNSGGSTSFGVSITVNDVAPSTLSYPSPNVFTVGSSIVNLIPSFTGNVTSFSIAPSLPSGLSFDTATGIISGTPTTVTPAATYTVTETNSGGSLSFGIVITVNDVAPSTLSYNSPNIFTKGQTITALSPSISGTVLSYSISPALPSGLSFDTTSGMISGTPNAVSAATIYTVTAVNSGGSTSFGVSITVNDVSPSALSYNSPNVFTVGSSMVNLVPTFSGNVTSFSITPSLPSGLSFDTTSGVISGTPNVVSAAAIYTVTAFNSGGSTSFGISITVNDVAPSVLSYPSPNIFTKGQTITALTPSISGSVISYSITPSLPSGLSFDTTSGVISGTPNTVSVASIYTVTAVNSGGSTSFGVSITVNDVAPSVLSYPSPNIFTKGQTITALTPSISGSVISYSITPSLPSGLSFDTTSGVISGTPNAVSPAAIYTVTAFNSGGSTSFGVSITVNDVAPSTLSYPSPNVFTVGSSIADLVPSFSGNITSFSIAPALPLGLSFDTTSGVISGTPNAVSSTAIYTVTAMNSGGSTSFGVSITVNDVAPSTLSYNSPNVFTKGQIISALVPTISGTVVSYSIAPALPSGLLFDTTSGVISGTPNVVSSTAIYTVTAINSGGSTSFSVSITVNDIAPSALSYSSPNVFTKGQIISALVPTISGTVLSYSISPALPSGLSFDTASGVISGTPNAVSSTAIYTVTALNSGGSTSFGVSITVNDVAPSALSYNSPNVFTKGQIISALAPTISGTVVSYSIAPALPSGLSFDTTSGVISGTPTAVSSAAIYTVTALNSGGSTSFEISITVNDVAPSTLSYNSPNVFTVGSSIADLVPSFTGNVTSFSIAPSLPSGLSFDTTTGVISGTPTAVSSAAIYTVTALNSGGSTSFGVSITVNDVAPSALSYNSPNVFTVGSSIVDLVPTFSGNVTSFSIAPALPSGLSFDTTTGIISGTPNAVSSTAIYTVTALNSGGSTSFGVSITVNDVAPSALSYTSPNVFTVGSSIVNLVPSFSGNVTSFSIAPALPSGLSFDTTTGIISGTPNAVSSTSIYTVTAINSGGSTSFGVSITVNDVAPSTLSYTSPNVFTVGSSILNLVPSFTGNVSSFSIAPALPSGLSFDTTTGIISGTPTTVTPTATYTVTETNSGGSLSFGIVITVNDVAPSTLSYPSPNVFTVGSSIVNLVPSFTGNVTSFSIAPALPSGLSFDTTSGVISGTPNAVSSTAIYTVTAFNSGGSTSFGVSITVNDVAPSTLSYNSPNVFTVGSSIVDLVPTFSGNVSSFSIAPALPSGLSFDTTSGVISGTPTTVTPTATYTVTETNSGGSLSFGIVITVNDIAPSTLSYNSPNVFTVGSSIVNLTPTFSGNVSSFSITPSLPSGLSFDTTSGVISGTPTTVTPTAIYTVTALNSGGSTSFGISITVNDVAPSALSYSSPNVFTVGSSIADLVPSFSGDVTSFSIAPDLSSGLSFDTTSGVISGTPTAISSTTIYTVTAFNSGGSTSFGISITVNDVAPSALSYNSPNVFTVGSSIVNLVPSFTGNVTSFSIAPALPSGLSFDTTTGIISGTPTNVTPTAIYTVTALNSGGSTSFGVSITVNDVAPSALSYTSPNVFTVGSPIVNLVPTFSGNVTSFSIAPSLPSGLSFDTATGIISGTPTTVTPTATYTVTETNSGGSLSFGIVITVNDVAPSALSYPSPNVFTVGSSIADLVPSFSGNVTSFSIAPALPSGLSFDTTSGVISGTPTAISSTAIYTVTAFNSGGSTSFGISITVNDVAPSALSYTSPNVFTLGSSIANIVPTFTGNVTSFSIAPALPSGLSFDTTSGVISGTPNAVSVAAIYTVTALNSGGSTSFGVSITVNDVAPSALSYSSPIILHVDQIVTDLWPTVTGVVSNYQIEPQLPEGLFFDVNTGQISGTPTQITPTAAYTITAFNSGGSTSFELILTIDESMNIDGSDWEQLLVYPNPFIDFVRVDGIINVAFELYAVDGKRIRQGNANGQNIDLSGLPSGVYLLQLKQEHKTKTVKLIKR